jgi:phosphoglycolate phosphatase-like HAD superfamily hydrolase
MMLLEKLQKYKTLIFDCDGVVLNSNKVKTEAFYDSAVKKYGDDAATALANYHKANGGISRYKKFEFFLSHIVDSKSILDLEVEFSDLIKKYAEVVRLGLMSCKVAENIFELRSLMTNSNWLIVSGGDQNELREIFKSRDLFNLFDGGIFGSPLAKDDIFQRELDNGNIKRPALFLGDSKYDFQVSKSAELDFLFISEWSEVSQWDAWCNENSIQNLPSISSIFHQAK